MIINSKTSAVSLEEGDSFVEERQDDDNIWRIGTYLLASGAKVLVWRHFSQIGPLILDPEGKRVETELNRETYTVVPINVQER